MIKKLFFWLLKKYSQTEKDRLIIFSILHDSVSDAYNEQNRYGNLYNAYIEFIMSSLFIKKLVKMSRRGLSYTESDELKMIKSGMDKSFDDAIEYIKKEKI